MINKFFISANKAIEIWLIIALTVFLLGYFIFPTSSKQNTFFYLGVCIPVVLLLPSHYKKLKPQSWLVVTALAFAFYLFLNSLWSIHFSAEQSLRYFRYLFTLYCLFGAVFFVCHKIPNYSEFLFKGIVVVGFFHSIYGIWDHFSSFNEPFRVRYSTNYYNPIDSAMRVGLLLLTCVWLMMESKTWRDRIFYLCLSIPFIIIMLLAKSRGPELALLIALPFVAYFQEINIKKFILMGLILFMGLGVTLFLSDLAKMVFDRGVTFPYRREIWLASLDESFDYFWFGQGASHRPPLVAPNGSIYNHSHNVLLAVFRMGGFIGLGLFMSNLLQCFFAGFKQDKSLGKLWVIWLFFGVLCLMTNGQYPLTRPTSLWFAYWIPSIFICASFPKCLPIKNGLLTVPKILRE